MLAGSGACGFCWDGRSRRQEAAHACGHEAGARDLQLEAPRAAQRDGPPDVQQRRAPLGHDAIVLTDTEMTMAIAIYIADVQKQFASGQAAEHAYRPALKRLLETLDDTRAVNDPKQSEFGAPDFVLLSDSNPDIVKGHGEAKDIGSNLDKAEASEQMQRYAGYSNLFLTDYLEFRFYANGERYQTVILGRVERGSLVLQSVNGPHLMRELTELMARPPETITSGRRLAQIMGAKARLVRDNVAKYLELDEGGTSDIQRIYGLMREMLVKDLSRSDFADMYAQTLVYGLFVARHSDKSPETFSRAEARDLVPASNPFLRQFFDHLAGASFDERLARIVDSLCDVFRASDVAAIVHQHVNAAVAVDSGDDKDPIIHFYEDFLQAYDPAERRKRGAYYTPVPVVQYIIRRIDEALRDHFAVDSGLASDEMIHHEYDAGQVVRKNRRFNPGTTVKTIVPRVQVLDPAVGTGTFLNETIKLIYESFRGQEGLWPTYVRDNLVPRLYGFELMMGPYTIAHLKLGTTLAELGVPDLKRRLNVMLTNTLEEGVPAQQDLFAFGLAEAVTEESRLASEVKSQRPVMVVLGNPPYSGVSSNETVFANSLVAKYKVEPGGASKLNERKHWLNDDYVKFIAFAEEMVDRNGSGIVGMITNNGYLDGPTFRGMRWRLTQTFDQIDILDLHGNTLKRETAPDGRPDENVFDIKPGVAIIVAVKYPTVTGKPCAVRRADLWGTRRSKFDKLNADAVTWRPVSLGRRLNFTLTSSSESMEYLDGVSVGELFGVMTNAAASARDALNFAFDRDEVARRMEFIRDHDESAIRAEFHLRKDSRDWTVPSAKEDVLANYAPDKIERMMYRPFDWRYTFYSGNSRGIYSSPQAKALRHIRGGVVGLMVNRKVEEMRPWADVFVTSLKAQYHALSSKETNSIAPLYLFDAAGDKHSNLAPDAVARLAANLSKRPNPGEVLSYVYGILHSPTYRSTFDYELKQDFPRVPVPAGDADFARLVKLGQQLVEVHTLKGASGASGVGAYPVAGSDQIEEVRYASSRVYINETQYFAGVSRDAWDYTVGSYRPAERWLLDRVGSRLGHAELKHFQRVLRSLAESVRLVALIG